MSSSPRDDQRPAGTRVRREVSTAPSAGNSEEQRQGASVLLFRGDAVLLVRRGSAGAAAGLWSAPGGHRELGETTEQAVRRELAEETGLVAGALIEVCMHKVAAAGDAEPAYRISVFTGVAATDALPVAASDAAEARFVPLVRLGELAVTDGLAGIIARAAATLGIARPA